MDARTVKLTIITDFTCTNCCVTEHELLHAIAYVKETLKLNLVFEIEHLPFKLISADVIAEDLTNVNKTEFLEKHLGAERFAKLQEATAKWAEEKGIPISFRGLMSPTTRAHRLCQKAYMKGGQNLQLPLILAIFKANMEDGRDIADDNVLAEIAEKTNVMSKEEALTFLESDELQKEVSKMCTEARAKGISGVPVVVIDGKFAISGGQSSEVFVQIFKKLSACRGCPNSVPSSPFPGEQALAECATPRLVKTPTGPAGVVA